MLVGRSALRRSTAWPPRSLRAALLGLLLAALTGCGRGTFVHVEPRPDAGQGVPPCDLLVQNCPNPTEACFPLTTGGAGCAPAGTRGEGAPCARATDCNGGFTCAGGADAVCTRLCAPTSAVNVCSEGQVCSAAGVCTPAGSYRACFVGAGLDHLSLIRSEPARNLCAVIALASPEANTRMGLSLPPDWAVLGATVSRTQGGCPMGVGSPSGVVATEVSGRIAFALDGGPMPDRVEALVTLTLPSDAGVPAQLTIQVSELPVLGCL